MLPSVVLPDGVTEGLGVPLLEAEASGLPIVATNVAESRMQLKTVNKDSWFSQQTRKHSQIESYTWLVILNCDRRWVTQVRAKSEVSSTWMFRPGSSDFYSRVS